MKVLDDGELTWRGVHSSPPGEKKGKIKKKKKIKEKKYKVTWNVSAFGASPLSVMS